MKKAQAIRFWKELEESTELEEILRKYEHRKGYASRRTLHRYAQAANGFREGLPFEQLAKKTGWTVTLLEKIRPWWEEFRRGKEKGAPELPMADHLQQALRDVVEHIRNWVRDFSNPSPLSASGPPTVMPYDTLDGSQKLRVAYGAERDPAYVALKQRLAESELWAKFERYRQVRGDYWNLKLAPERVEEVDDTARISHELFQELFRLSREVDAGFQELLLSPTIPGRVEWRKGEAAGG